jgi:hypothetical protein
MTSIKAEHFSKTYYDKQVSLDAAQCKATVWGRPVAEIAGSNHVGGIDVSLVSVLFGKVVVSSLA